MTTKPKQETWANWGNPGDDAEHDPLRTREELIAFLAKLDVPVAVTDLRFWEGAGILPRAIKRWHEETRSVRALYPITAAAVIEQLRDLQAAGYTLSQIARILRGRALTYFAADPYNLFPTIQEAVRTRVQQTGEPVAKVRITFTDASGHEEFFVYDFLPDDAR